MLKTVIALLILSVPSAVLSADKEFDNVKLCEAAGDLAEIVMSSRLDGLPMQTMVKKIATGAPNEKMVNKMIIEAYESPMYQTEEHKTKAISEFKNRWYLDCYRAVTKAK